LYEEIARNRRRTVVLILLTVVIVGALGYLFGYLLGVGIAGLVVALVISAVMSFVSYRAGHRLVLRAARAQPISHQEAPRLHNVVEGIALAAGLPKPAVYLIPEDAPNAFATGPDPEHSHIAVTRGLLEKLNRVELEGVVAHEMAHVRDRDILLGTVVASLVGSMVLIAEFMLRWFWWGRGRQRGNGVGGRAFAVLAVLGVVVAILTPLLAQVIRMAVSRRREYLADAQGAMLTRYPPGLASALKKIAADTTPLRVANNATAHLWLNQPSRVPGEKTHWFESLFRTHPPIQDRIRILDEM
jgi:heat shock protein HtpX